jgi:hypothetical protein
VCVCYLVTQDVHVCRRITRKISYCVDQILRTWVSSDCRGHMMIRSCNKGVLQRSFIKIYETPFSTGNQGSNRNYSSKEPLGVLLRTFNPRAPFHDDKQLDGSDSNLARPFIGSSEHPVSRGNKHSGTVILIPPLTAYSYRLRSGTPVFLFTWYMFQYESPY